MFGGGRNQHTTAQTPWVTCLSSYTAAGLELPTRGVNRGLPLKGHEAQILFIYMLRWSKRVCFKPLFGLNSFIVLSIRLLYFSCLEETAFLYLGKFFSARPRMFQNSNFKESHRPADRVRRGVWLCMVWRPEMGDPLVQPIHRHLFWLAKFIFGLRGRP